VEFNVCGDGECGGGGGVLRTWWTFYCGGGVCGSSSLFYNIAKDFFFKIGIFYFLIVNFSKYGCIKYL
jgi:hypothetical protein